MSTARKLKYDTEFFAEKCLKIKDKNGKIIPFKLNSSQKRLNDIISQKEKENKPIFVLILKARQIGFSTYTEAKIFHKTIMNKNINSLIVAHEDQASTNLFAMSKMYYDFLPQPLKPMLRASNAKELVFDSTTKDVEGLRSKITIQSARNVSASRSGTFQVVHISEIDFWQNPDEAMMAIMQTVPINKNTLVIIESTANGWGGYLHKLWQNSKNNKNDFIPFFVPWFEHEEYSMPAPVNFVPYETHPIYGNEKQLKIIYKLTNNQLFWRRWTIENKCNNDIRIFQQEYPSNDQEAFLTSGNARFNTEILAEYQTKPICPIIKGSLIRLENKDYRILESGKSPFEVYQKRELRKQYAIFADVAEGLEHGDYSCAKVFDILTWDQVAEWHGHIEHAEFGKVLVDIGRAYNNAVLVVEANNHGHSVITQIKNEKYSLHQLFVGKYISIQGDDDFKDPEKRYGWFTTIKTKKIIIDTLAYFISKKLIKGFNTKDIDELFSYVLDEQGRTNAMTGSHDDRVMTLAIAYYLLNNDKFRMYYLKNHKEWECCNNCKNNNFDICQEFDSKIENKNICNMYKPRKELYE